jgi:hypothetical protein
LLLLFKWTGNHEYTYVWERAILEDILACLPLADRSAFMLGCGGFSTYRYGKAKVDPGNSSAEAGGSPLYYACTYGHLDVAKWLSANGAKIRTRPDNGYVHADPCIFGLPPCVWVLTVKRADNGWNVCSCFARGVVCILAECRTTPPHFVSQMRCCMASKYLGEFGFFFTYVYWEGKVLL